MKIQLEFASRFLFNRLFLEETSMKSLAFFALTVVASAAAIAAPASYEGKITIDGRSEQTVRVNSNSTVNNHASERATAIQNLSSNRGDITLKSNAKSFQTTTLNDGNARNRAKEAGDIAIQNVASNYGTVEISGRSEQTARLTGGGSLSNTADGQGASSCKGEECKDNAKAMQNTSSNVGDVEIKSSGKSVQTTKLDDTNVNNKAEGKGAVAIQSLASNTGDVTISGKSEQTVRLNGSTVRNLADGKKTTAVQNIASNYEGVQVKGRSEQTVSGDDGTIVNKANGANSQAFQNLSSNFGDVSIGSSGKSVQLTVVKGTVMNWANGRGSVAVQNLASNDACQPPEFNLPSCPSGKCWTTASN